jgi:hypothetical protein
VAAIQQEINILEVFITKKEQDNLNLTLNLRKRGIITTLGRPFKASQKQEINALIVKEVFEFVLYNKQIHKGRIFNLRLVNKVKGKATKTLYKKSRLVIQAYNNKGKQVILTQSPIIQRASQRLIIAFTPSFIQHRIRLFVQDITQVYIQATTFLN